MKNYSMVCSKKNLFISIHNCLCSGTIYLFKRRVWLVTLGNITTERGRHCLAVVLRFLHRTKILMASESEIEVSEEDLVVDRKTFEEVESQIQKKVQTLFLRTDVILEVEGRQIHVNRQMLADHSPVFQGMFESDFKEKHMDNIPLPDKKFEDFEIFLSSFYYNEFQQTITGNDL